MKHPAQTILLAVALLVVLVGLVRELRRPIGS